MKAIMAAAANGVMALAKAAAAASGYK